MSIKNIVSLILVLFSIMISCIPIDKTIGDQFVPGDYILKVDTASFDLKIITKLPDSIQSISYAYMTIGYLSDPVFGVTTSSTIVQIFPYSDTSDFGDSQQIKSVLLKLTVSNINNYSEQDEGIAQNISVYQLKKGIDSTTVFNTSFTKDDYDPTPIHLGAPVYYGGDTIGITLSNVFGEELLRTTPGEFVDPKKEGFLNRIKGLYITTDPPKEVKKGGRLNYLPVGASSLTLNFLMTDAEQGLVNRDTSEFFSVGYGFAVNAVHSGSGKLASDKEDKTIYIDGFSGVKPYINGAELKIQLDTWLKAKEYTNSSIILSKASIILPFKMPADYTDIDKRYPKTIWPCIIDSLKLFKPLDGVYYNYDITENGRNINRSLMTYPCEITTHIQDLIKKDLTEVDSSDDLWFSSILISADASGSPIYQFDSQNYWNASLNGPNFEDEDRRPKLSLVFTVLKERD